MTLVQFIFGSLMVYLIIHLHRTRGFKYLKCLFFDAFIGIFIGLLLAVLLYYFIFQY